MVTSRSTWEAGSEESATLDVGERWRFLVTPPATGAENMALDHALLRRAAATGEGTLRLYSWAQPTLSLGRHQPAKHVYDIAAIRSGGVDVVRRPTGGRAVLHFREITYSVTTPRPEPRADQPRSRVRDVYRAINAAVVDALQTLGAPVALSGAPDGVSARAVAPSAAPCFDHAAEGEVVANGLKLAGSAQWHENGALLQHGSILIDDDQQMLARLAQNVSVAPVATLHQLLRRAPDFGELATAFRCAFDRALVRADRHTLRSATIDRGTVDAAAELRNHYADDTWTWRH